MISLLATSLSFTVILAFTVVSFDTDVNTELSEADLNTISLFLKFVALSLNTISYSYSPKPALMLAAFF